MTLFRQIAIMLSVFLLIILATVLVLNFQSANKSVKERLYENAKNSATSLSLSLGGAKGDKTMMSTMINANFDSGHYKEISLVDVQNRAIFSKVGEKSIKGVPQWFIDAIDMKAPVAMANVSAGWSQVGILKVQSDAGYAVAELYVIFTDLLISFFIITLVGLFVLNFLLHTILKPLKDVQKQAAAVMENEFIIQEKIPYTAEFKDVVLGMNNMVSKVKAMLEKGNRELKAHKELEYIDQPTGLRNRKYLIDKLPSYLKIDSAYEGGSSMLIALSGIIEANEQLGRSEVDTLLQDFASLFKLATRYKKEAVVSRLNGTEFSILLPNVFGAEAIAVAQNILTESKLITDARSLNGETIFLSIGIYEYKNTNSIAELMSFSDNALSQARFNNENIYFEKAKAQKDVMGKDAWRLIIKNAIDKQRFNLVTWNAVNTQTKTVFHNVLSISLALDKQTAYSYARFMAPAIQIGLSNDIYKTVVDMLLKSSTKMLSPGVYALRLPREYLESAQTYKELDDLLRANAALLGFKLIIELPDRFVREDSKLVRQYIEMFRKYSIQIGIFEFIGDSEEYVYLQQTRPKYIKGESSYFLSQSHNSLLALKLITDAMDISLIAVGVADLEAVESLDKMGIHIVQGPVTELLK